MNSSGKFLTQSCFIEKVSGKQMKMKIDDMSLPHYCK